MSKRKNNGDTGDSAVTTADPETWGGKKKPKPRMVVDADTGESRPENKHQKFVRLATTRMRNALKRLSQLETLGNRNQYTYSAFEADKVCDALMLAVERIRNAFQGQPTVVESFTL